MFCISDKLQLQAVIIQSACNSFILMNAFVCNTKVGDGGLSDIMSQEHHDVFCDDFIAKRKSRARPVLMNKVRVTRMR